MPPLGAAQVRRIDEYRRGHLGDDLTVVALAGVANVSRFHFIRAFAATTGLAPHRYLRRLRMRAAADLLATTTYSVARVAVMCGYRSAGQFAAAFRAEHQLSPAEFRRSR